jgi:hypothetical protein
MEAAMSSLLELAPTLGQDGRLRQAQVVDVVEGAHVRVALAGTTQVVDCQVLQTGSAGLSLSEGDAVLVWLQHPGDNAGVLLGKIGPYTQPTQAVVAPDEFAKRPQTLVLEAQGDVVLRNGQAKITLGAKGDVEIVCASFTTRSHRLLRLLAPLIKLN